MSILSDNKGTIALNDLQQALSYAANDDNVKGIYLEVGSLNVAPASAQAIRSALTAFKESGKFIVAYADNYDQNAYWIASTADKIYMNPQGNTMLRGVTMGSWFFGETLKKLGIKMQVFRVGTFKSAVEPYISDHMSIDNRLQMQSLADGIWQDILSDISISREVPTSQLQAFADNGDFFKQAELTVTNGLVDSLCYKSAMDSVLKVMVGAKPTKYTYSELKKIPVKLHTKADQIAVLYASGAIDGGSNDGINSDDICKELEKLANNKKVKAVVLRVNSPGGSAFGSEQMWHAAEMLKEKKTLVVSMGDYAASGGYYMSCNADKIVAEPTTLTGSIGIFGLIPDVQGLFNKVGLAVDGVSTAKYADLTNISRPMSTDEKMLFQSMVNNGYELFVKRCAEGRDLSIADIEKVAQGRVWLGQQAVEIGLVDTLGGLNTAIEIAAQLANIDTYNVKSYPAKKDLFTKIMEDFKVSASAKLLEYQIGDYARYFNHIKEAEQTMGIQARIPFNLIAD